MLGYTDFWNEGFSEAVLNGIIARLRWEERCQRSMSKGEGSDIGKRDKEEKVCPKK